MIVYKLTKKDRTTKNNTLWAIGKTNTATGECGLCGPGWLHCYEYPLLAVFHDPIHGSFGTTARMFRCEAGGQILRDSQMKIGCTELRPIDEIDFPTVTTIQRIAYAIYCVKEVFHDLDWNEWADSVVWSEEMAEAFGVVADMMERDHIAARKSFLAAYQTRVDEARDKGRDVKWTASLGTYEAGRDRVLLDAVNKRRLSPAQARVICPALPPMQGEVRALEPHKPEADCSDVVKQLANTMSLAEYRKHCAENEIEIPGMSLLGSAVGEK
jgi:hypothetical protein